MSKIFAKITAFFMFILSLFGIGKNQPGPAPEPVTEPATEAVTEIVTGHNMSVDVGANGVIGRAYCTDEGCGAAVNVNIELPMRSALAGSYDCSDDSWKNVDNSTVFVYNSTDFNAYVRGLEQLGCTLTKTYSMGNNRYAVMKHPYFTAYVSLCSAEGQLRAVIGRSDELTPPDSTGAATGETAPKLWQLDIDNAAAGANGGMGYILQLSNGSYIVVDGGYRTDADADAIWDVLVQNNVPGREKPVIAAWFITHQHIDHYGAFYKFTEKYKDSAEVNAFYYNLPYKNVGDIYPQNCRNIESCMASWPGAALYRKLHSGMSFTIGDAKITVICTFEDVYPFTIEDGNDTSLVFKVELGGQSILFTGDAEYGESNRMKYLDASVLKSDFMQYPHHGYDKQCKEAFYTKVSPAVVLWPMPFYNHEGEGTVFAWRYEERAENAWVRTAECVKKIVVSDEGLTRFELPYTPTGARICDYPR